MTMKRFLIASLILCVVTACSDDEGIDDGDVGFDSDVASDDTGPPSDVETDPEDVEPDAEKDVDAGEDPIDHPVATCDDLVEEVCAFPWPSNLYLAPDETRSTGYELQFGEETLPANNQNVHISPDLFDHLDGYGLGVPIMALFPDLDDSALPHEYELEDSLAEEAQILLFEVRDDALVRIPYFAELDLLEEDSEQQTLFVRPAVILEDDTRYVVAFRDLTDTGGNDIEPSPTFEALVDGDTDDDPVLRHRQQRFDEVFSLLSDVGVEADSLTLAWDFVTASSEALHGPMLQIRDDAFAWADTHGIEWTVGDVREFTDDPEDESDLSYDEHIGLELNATIEVPHYLEPYEEMSGGWQLHRNGDGVIARNDTRQADIMVRIPHRALDGDDIGVVQYGHGLLGTREGIVAGHLGELAEEFGYAVMAVDLVGMSTDDIAAALEAVLNLNHFVAMSDRLHQGLLEFLLAARTAGDEMGDLDALTSRDVTIDDEHIYYFGASQGGIFGHSFMALTPDVERGFLAVPGNNYSTLLHRSVNFDDFNDGMALAYDTSIDRNINVAAMNLLWANTEPVSFARHIRRAPFDGEPRDVLLAAAKGDWQVATITNENTARSDVEIPLMENYDIDREPFDAEVATYPHDGSATILFDFGNPWPPPGNLPPSDELGDPHGRLTEVDDIGLQVDTFFRDGEVIDICDNQPCRISDL